jgi:hypothetical protein
MRTITLRLPAAEFSAAIADMRDWLDQNQCEPSRFKYDQESEAIVLSVEFLDDKHGERFVRLNFTGSKKPEAGRAITLPRLRSAIRWPPRLGRSAALIARRGGAED